MVDNFFKSQCVESNEMGWYSPNHSAHLCFFCEGWVSSAFHVIKSWICRGIKKLLKWDLFQFAGWWFGTFEILLHSVGNFIIPTDSYCWAFSTTNLVLCSTILLSLVIIRFNGTFHYKPSSYWSNPSTVMATRRAPLWLGGASCCVVAIHAEKSECDNPHVYVNT